jgi:hypothetical protein
LGYLILLDKWQIPNRYWIKKSVFLNGLYHKSQLTRFSVSIAQMISKGRRMVIRTRVFELCNGKYRNLSELARAMGLSLSQVYRVREGKRNINQKFIIGAKKAFPDHNLDDLFYFAANNTNRPQSGPDVISDRYQHIVEQYNNGHSVGSLMGEGD